MRSNLVVSTLAEAERPGAGRPPCAPLGQRLPGGPHGEAMRRLARKYPGLPMLVVTAYPYPPPLPHRGVFTKPFDTGELLAAVEGLRAAGRPGASR